MAWEEGALAFVMPNASQGIEKKISTERRKLYEENLKHRVHKSKYKLKEEN